ERFDCWASAMLKGEHHATIHRPPNHKLFDSDKPLSPVLAQRLKNSKPNGSDHPNQPVINFSFGNELVNLLQPRPAAAPVALAPVLDVNCASLLQPSRVPGNDMPLAEFCVQHGLGQGILQKFQDNEYHHARTLRFVTIPELKEMGFRLGE